MKHLCCALVALAMGSASGQTGTQTAIQGTEEGRSPLKGKVNVVEVEVPVVVRDQAGNTIGSVRRSDFRLFDAGRLQAIRGFVRIDRAIDSGNPHGDIPPSRFLACILDDLRMNTLALQLARDAIVGYLAAPPPLDDWVAILTTSGGTVLDFTKDKAKLLQALTRIRMQQPDMSEGQASLRMLRGVVQQMSALPGSRIVLLISPGFLTREIPMPFGGARKTVGLPLKQETGEIVERAIAGQLVINCLDSKGLYGSPAIPSPRISEIFSDVTRSVSEVLAELADGTGGRLYENNNDLKRGIRLLLGPPEFSYLLSFSPANLKYDGAYHALKVTLSTPGHFEVQARRGYNAPNR